MKRATIIPVTDLRRNFGEITSNLPEKEPLVLTKGGEPFAILKSAPEVKRKKLKKAAGAWKGTALDSDDVWDKVAERRSRSSPVAL